MIEKELCLPMFASEHNYVVHDFWVPFPNYLKDINYDAIVLTQTFLGARSDPSMRAHMQKHYWSLLQSNRYKIALPQDDYTCNHILDNWLMDWNIDLNYPVCVNDWNVLYPRYSKKGFFKQGFTGYINDSSINDFKGQKKISLRKKDVCYRAANLSPAFGRLGQVKAEYGNRFIKATMGMGFELDVSTRPSDTIFGTNWHDFVQNTKCMLGTNSGSSLLDPVGDIANSVFRYQLRHPRASFEEVEAACFPGLDGRHVFTAISPRNLECALFGTVQILTPGAYGGFMEPWKDYIPLEPNMSNINDAVQLLRSKIYLQEMADRCREKILSFPELRYSNHVNDLIGEIRSNSSITNAERGKSVPIIQRYHQESKVIVDKFWRKKRLRNKIRKVLAENGFRWAKYMIKDLFHV